MASLRQPIVLHSLFINSSLIHMKRILTSGIAALVAVLFLAGCETDPNSSAGAPEIRPMAPGGGSQADPDPAIAYGTTVTSKGKTYRGIAVMDSNGTNPTVIYKASSTEDWIGQPTWNPGGTTLAYQVKVPGASINLIDVSVSRGKVTGSNNRTLMSTSDDYINHISWSSLSSTNKIAFTTQVRGGPTQKVQVISTSGGTPTVLYQTESANGVHFYRSVTWSPDDSKIAFVDRAHTTGQDTIRVINASTGALLEVIPLGAANNFTYIDWSNAGTDLLAMSLNDKLYYVTPTTGSTPWTNNVTGYQPTWSPTNTAVLTATDAVFLSALQKTAYGTSTTTSLGGLCYAPDWK